MTTEEILFYAAGLIGAYIIYRMLKKKMKSIDEKEGGSCSSCPMQGSCGGGCS